MYIADNTVKKLLSNAYFIWGSGKTTAANSLADKHNFYVYHTDDRARHFENAEPEYQPALCRDVPDFWSLDREDALAWERDIVREMTPMIIADLIQLCGRYDRVICEGDIDIDAVIPVIDKAHAVTISNHGRDYDFFDRPDQMHMLDGIKNRTDIDEAEKQRLIDNAYSIAGISDRDEKSGEADCTATVFPVPRETELYGIKEIIRDETTSVDDVVRMIEEYWQI